MATLSGVNYALLNSEPTSKAGVGELTGSVKVLYDEHTFAADVNGVGDIIKIGGLLPKGARIVDAQVKCPSLGTTGILSFGYAASDDSAEAADADGLIVVAQLDAGGQAVLGKATAASAAVGKVLAGAVQPQLIFTEASDNAEGVKIQAWVSYVMD
jgi:hypothetical protein